MNWKRMFIAALTRSKYKAFVADTMNPEQVRETLWHNEIVPLIQKSKFWQSKLISPKLDDFSITTYEDYRQELLEAQNSTIQPFNGESLIFWSETSGTSGARKFFPITRSFQKQFQRTMPPFIYSLTQRFPGFFKEKILYLVAVDANRYTAAGIPSGWISNFNYRNLPSFIKRFYAMPSEVFANDEIYKQWAPVYGLASDLSAIFAVTPMVIDVFYQRCAEEFHHYLPYLLGEKKLPEQLPQLKISNKRQRYLKTLPARKLTFKELWPSLELGGCWISGLCEYPAEQLQQLMGPDISLVDGTYSATEGWLTVPLETNQLGGILHPGAHVVEFIEEGLDIDKNNLVQSWELKEGTHYEVFLTTAMGFVRYQLGDVVKCTGYFNKAPRLEFCYKTQLLKLESCAVSNQELQGMIKAAQFEMQAHWFFARNNLGNKIVLVTDNEVSVDDALLERMHQLLQKISSSYAHSIETQEVLPMVLLQLPKDELKADSHGQTKPTLISKEVITQK